MVPYLFGNCHVGGLWQRGGSRCDEYSDGRYFY